MANPLDDVLHAGETRRHAMMEMVKAVAQPIQLSTAPRAKTLRAMLAALQHFGERQLSFFLNEFGEAETGLLDSHPLYSAKYALDVTYNQIGYDLDVILRAYHHRTHRISPVGQQMTKMRETLSMADHLAAAALAPATESQLIGRATALSYFQKSPSVRVIPYAPVALIGIPFTATGMPRDLATVTHEVGHYVFSRWVERAGGGAFQPADGSKGIANRKNIELSRRALAAEAPMKTVERWLSSWQEEIFADVYSCIIGGPTTGFTMLEMLSGLPATRWLEDDGEHPLPILRLGIYAATMREMAQDVDSALATGLKSAALELEKATNAWLNGPLPPWLTFTPRGGSPIRLDLAREIIDEAVTFLVQGDFADLCPQGDQPGKLWNEAPFDMTSVNRRAEKALNEAKKAPTPDLQMAPAPDHVKWNDESDSWPIGVTGLNMDWEAARDERSTDAIETLKARGWEPWWLVVLSAGFWTTEGPGAGNPHPPG